MRRLPRRVEGPVADGMWPQDVCVLYDQDVPDVRAASDVSCERRRL